MSDDKKVVPISTATNKDGKLKSRKKRGKKKYGNLRNTGEYSILVSKVLDLQTSQETVYYEYPEDLDIKMLYKDLVAFCNQILSDNPGIMLDMIGETMLQLQGDEEGLEAFEQLLKGAIDPNNLEDDEDA
jgi:hypothetical protein